MYKSIPTVEALAIILASKEKQAMMIRELDLDNTEINALLLRSRACKPKDTITHCPDVLEPTQDEISIPSVNDIAKSTLLLVHGFDEIDPKWLHSDAGFATVTQDHRDAATKQIASIQNSAMMNVLKGVEMNKFTANLTKLVEQTEVTKRDIGLLAYAPQTARNIMEKEHIDNKKAQFANSKALGKPGDKVWLSVTVFNTIYFSQFDSTLFDCHDEDGNLVSFFKNGDVKTMQKGGTYKINAKIKEAGPNKYSYGAIVNSLNYVRLNK